MEFVMTEDTVRYPIPLPAPVVPSAYPEDGLLKISALENPVPVEVRVWEAAEPGYYFQLMLNGVPQGEIRVISENDQAGDTITIFLSETAFEHEGTYELGYKTTSPNTEVSDDSATVTLRVDRTQPGASLLAPLIFPTATFSDQLTGLLPGYAGMQQGDVVQTLLNGSLGPTHTVTADELTLSPIEIVFTREHLQGHVPGMVSIEYTVTDRAGNTSITSLPTLVSVQL